MAQEPEVLATEADYSTTDQQPPSPNGSTSSREETRATREKLKKTSIAGLAAKLNPHEPLPTTDSLADSNASISDLANDSQNGIRGRPAKKRSFEDLAKDDVDTDATSSVAQPPLPKSGHHKRMRSRDVNSGDQSQAYTRMEADPDNILHEETDVDAQKAPGGPGVLVDAPSQEEMDSEKTTHLSQTDATSTSNDISTTTAESARTQIPPTSGFANASSASPFGAAKSPTNQQAEEIHRPASTSAFASSGLSAFASSEKSPFGAAAGAKSPLGGSGGFGGATSSGGFGSVKSGFGSTAAFSTSGISAFAPSSGGFGSAKGFGSGASSFGAPKPFGVPSTFGIGGTSTFGSGKPIGTTKAEDDKDEDGDNEGDEDALSNAEQDTQQDPRFRQQQIDTGEADEEVHFTSRARLYFFEGSWKERGTGNLKVNVNLTMVSPPVLQDDPEAQPSGSKRKARLLMRADATHRVLLNSPVFKGMRFGAPDGSEPTGKIMHLQSLEEGKAIPLQIKIGKEEVLKELYHKLKELEQEA